MPTRTSDPLLLSGRARYVRMFDIPKRSESDNK